MSDLIDKLMDPFVLHEEFLDYFASRKDWLWTQVQPDSYESHLDDQDNSLEHSPMSAERPEGLASTNKMLHGPPFTPVNSTSGSSYSEMTGSAALTDEIKLGEDYEIYPGSGKFVPAKCAELQKLELSLHEINTLDCEDLVKPPAFIDSGIQREGDALSSDQQMQYELRSSMNNLDSLADTSEAEDPNLNNNIPLMSVMLMTSVEKTDEYNKAKKL